MLNDPAYFNRTRKRTFKKLLREYEDALASGTLPKYKVEIYKENIKYFKEVIKSL